MATTVKQRFEIIIAVFAQLEVTGEVDLVAFAAERGLTVQHLKEIITPVVFLQWRDRVGNITGADRAFLITEDDHLVIDEGHWLAAAQSAPPTAAHAVRLMVAAMSAQIIFSDSGTSVPGLEKALVKLKAVVNAAVEIKISIPPLVAACQDALKQKRNISFAYFGEASAQRNEYEIEPGFVGSAWGNWYLIGYIAGTRERRTFRIDRMISATVTDTPCEPDTSIALPDEFPLDEYKQTVRLRLPKQALDRILPPVEVSVVSGEAEVVVADITVYSTHRLIDTLVVLGAEAEVIDDPDRAKIRSQQATEILKLYR